jgi:peroxiredoxin
MAERGGLVTGHGEPLILTGNPVCVGEEAAAFAALDTGLFAQRRWCGAAGAENLRTLSDHRDASFGAAYGLFVRETRLLARAVLVVDRARAVRYIEIVKELGSEPDHGAALRAVCGLL